MDFIIKPWNMHRDQPEMILRIAFEKWLKRLWLRIFSLEKNNGKKL